MNWSLLWDFGERRGTKDNFWSSLTKSLQKCRWNFQFPIHDFKPKQHEVQIKSQVKDLSAKRICLKQPLSFLHYTLHCLNHLSASQAWSSLFECSMCDVNESILLLNVMNINEPLQSTSINAAKTCSFSSRLLFMDIYKVIFIVIWSYWKSCLMHTHGCMRMMCDSSSLYAVNLNEIVVFFQIL